MNEAMTQTRDAVSLEEAYGARTYDPLPVVIREAEGVWVRDTQGTKYLDMLSAYSAVNQGHRHPQVIRALKEQADRVTLTSRAFHNDQLGAFLAKLAQITGKDLILPMNTGAEAVETALKAARQWANQVKGIPDGAAEIIVCERNFHGRTVTVVSMSSNGEYQRGFGPLTPGFRIVPFGDVEALRSAITPRTAAFLVEPIQGEAGIIIPPDGYLKHARELCRERNILLMADEIQTGLGRTGKMFACEWENVIPDVYILGKALGAGVVPVSAVAANRDILGLFKPGSHGSTFGGNPLACAVAIAALDVIEREGLAERSDALGKHFLEQLQTVHSPVIEEVRGRGLFVALQLSRPARPYCLQLMNRGILCKETHERVIRFAPPLVIGREELDWAIDVIREVFEDIQAEP